MAQQQQWCSTRGSPVCGLTTKLLVNITPEYKVNKTLSDDSSARCPPLRVIKSRSNKRCTKKEDVKQKGRAKKQSPGFL